MMYDLIIIGGGSAGFSAAYHANKLNKKVLMINYSKIVPLGGTCVNVGCVPSKVMLTIGETYYKAKHSKFKAIEVKGRADFLKALEETRKIVNELRKENYEKTLNSWENVDFVEGKAKLKSNNEVEVNGKTYKGKYIFISTGVSPNIPKIKGIENVRYETYKTIFNLDYVPKKAIVIGGNVQALEMACMFHYFGIETTILSRSFILKGFEEEIREKAYEYFTKEGIKIKTNVKFKEVKQNGKEVEIIIEHNDEIENHKADLLYLATGVKPNLPEGLENANLKVNEKGFIKINDYMQTSQPNIYAGGDVTGMLKLETTAARQGKIAVENMFLNKRATINYSNIPQVVFTYPRIAKVGITEEGYFNKHGTCLCFTLPLNKVEKAKAVREDEGIIKIVLDHKTKEIIGMSIFSPYADELISLGEVIVKKRMKPEEIKDFIIVFPTFAEMIKKIAQSIDEDVDEMPCCVG